VRGRENREGRYEKMRKKLLLTRNSKGNFKKEQIEKIIIIILFVSQKNII